MSVQKRPTVVIRIRPTARFASDIIKLHPDDKTVTVCYPEVSGRGYVNNQPQGVSLKADSVLHNASQELVYDTCAQSVVSEALDGYNGTIMAYGQTGAGKTFTMTGTTENFKHRGIIPRAISNIFREIDERPEQSVSVRVSYLEIYNESMFDLLSTLPDAEKLSMPSAMNIVEDQGATVVKGLTIRTAHNEEEALNLLFEGETNRAIAAHSLNQNSSRSHCLFTIYIESRSRTETSAQFTLSKLNLVDLAGSERLKKTNSEGATQREAMYINKSLSFLEQVVVALGERNREHIPYRQSKLTHVLKDSLGGNCSTVMIANVWGEQEQIEETMSTLRLAQRMMLVKNPLVRNIQQDPNLLIKQYEKEIRTLKQELAMHNVLANRGQISYDAVTEAERYEIQQQVRRYLDGSLSDIEVFSLRQIHETFVQFKSVVRSLESDIETKLKQKYPEAKTSSADPKGTEKNASGPSEYGEGYVGDIDGQGFGVGVAPSSVRAAASSVVTARKLKSRKGREVTSGLSRDQLHSEAPSVALIPGNIAEETDGDEKGGEVPRPSTPPSKDEAFEEFKREKGSEIQRILTENKATLNEKKKSAHNLSRSVNVAKKEIDEMRAIIDEKERERLEQDDAGEEVIDEEEFAALKKLKELKVRYRVDYDDLKTVKSEIQYCQKLVDQCRQRLLSEFEKWYNDSYLLPEDHHQHELAGKESVASVLPEEEQDRLDRLHAQKTMEDPEAAAFYNAKLRTERRGFLGPASKKKPGMVTQTVRNKPPTTLTVT
ncbi:kinesin-like protein KIF9 [Oscarella lobularis]|uniref:kinesin-like protein KIF9 n=1 Tax=Oscarella lobularis TaxID=121494 RepID=UPI0033133B1D